MVKILVTDGMEKAAVERLRDMKFHVVEKHYEEKDLINEIKNYDVLVVRSATKVNKSIIDAAVATRKLKLVIRGGVGVDNIDVEYAESKGIAVRNTPNSSSTSVAELVLAHIFTLARFLHNSNITMREGKWNKKIYKGIEVAGKTLGIIGFGRIGRETAKRAEALGMKVVYYDSMGPMKEYKNFKYVQKEKLLARADFISLHVPQGPGGKAIIGEDEIAMMKDGAYLINCARGGVVDEGSLIKALDSGKLSGAAMDVFAEEPAKNNPLCLHEKVSCTPHIGGSTIEAQERIGEEIIGIVKEFYNWGDMNGFAQSI